MNKNIGIIIVIFVGVVILAGGGFYIENQNAKKDEAMKMAAEKASMKHEEDSAMMKKDKAKDAMSDDKMMTKTVYVLKGGDLMLEEGEKMTAVTKTVTLSDGTTISISGLVTKSDDTKTQLKEGESIGDDGIVMGAKMTDDKMMLEDKMEK